MEDPFSRESCVSLGNASYLWCYLSKSYSLINIQNIYHYTDTAGFLSIIKNREFWLSHIQFMNDQREYIEGKDRCKKVLMKMQHEYTGGEKELLMQVFNQLDDEISTGFFSRSSKNVFSLSFSRNRDSLDMWRGYGSRSGIAIGFDMSLCSNFAMMRKEQYVNELKKYGNDPEQLTPEFERLLITQNIIYDPEKIDKIITEVIKIGLEHYAFVNEKSPNIATISAVQYITDALFNLFPFLKNNGFKNEEECRIVENFARYTNEIPLQVYYRERNGIALPFIKYVLLDRNCRTLKQWPISEIIIGPGLQQQTLADSIRYFLNQQDMKELSNKVVLSSIPFVPNC